MLGVWKGVVRLWSDKLWTSAMLLGSLRVALVSINQSIFMNDILPFPWLYFGRCYTESARVMRSITISRESHEDHKLYTITPEYSWTVNI
jgi:hypothetical protein